jgi:predicted nucleic acid-binding protein
VIVVVDASVWVSALRPQDAAYDISDTWIANWTEQNGTIYVPSLFLSEVGGAVSRRSQSPALGVLAIEEILRDASIHVMPVTVELARLAGLRAAELFIRGADAIYVALAEQNRVPLITWDREQLSRASALIDVRAPHL